MSARPQLFARLAQAVTTPDDDPLALRLCRAFVNILEAEGGAITLAYTQPQRTTVCFTDAIADRLEDLQEVLGEGPGPDAFVSGQAVEGNLRGDQTDRWPMFADAAVSAAGAVTVHAFPMGSSPSVLGVITVYRRDSGPLAQGDADALFLADAIGAAIVRESTDNDGSRWDARDRINQATGMVVAQLGIVPDDALALMRAYAFSHELSLNKVADEVIARRQNFGRNADPRGEERS